MRQRLVFVSLLALILFLLGGILYTWGTPRLTAFAPGDAARNVPASARLELVFSRPMRADEVRQRLTIQPAPEGAYTWEGSKLIFTPTEPWPSGMTVSIRLQPGARAAGLLALPLGEEHTWTFSVRAPRLAYLYPADGAAELYWMDLQTGDTEQLTTSGGEVIDYSVAPGGLSVYYTTSRGTQGSAIHGLNLSTGQTHTLVDCPAALCRFPQAAPDGAALAYERAPLSGVSLPQVWLLALSEALTPVAEPALAGEPGHSTQEPLWSSNSILAFYDFDLTAFIFLDVQTGAKKLLSSRSGVMGSWSPDGGSYVTSEVFDANISDPSFLPDLSAIPSSHLLRYQLADDSLQDLTHDDDIEDTSPVFAPGGRLLAFARRYLDQTRWSFGRQLWLMQPDGGAARPLTNKSIYNHYNFAWSPGGDRLAYMRFNQKNPTEALEIWLINTDGSGAARLLTGGFAPQWIP